MPKSYFCFFSHFFSAIFFLDHPIAFGLLKDSTRQLSFSAFLFRKSAYHYNFLAWQQAWIISNKLHFTLQIFFTYIYTHQNSQFHKPLLCAVEPSLTATSLQRPLFWWTVHTLTLD